MTRKIQNSIAPPPKVEKYEINSIKSKLIEGFLVVPWEYQIFLKFKILILLNFQQEII